MASKNYKQNYHFLVLRQPHSRVSLNSKLTSVIPNESGNPSLETFVALEQSKLLLGSGLFAS